VSWLCHLPPLKAGQCLTGVSRKQQSSASRQAPNAVEPRQMAAVAVAAVAARVNLEPRKHPRLALLLLLLPPLVAQTCRCVRDTTSRSV
jgi:hypothetical protein